MLKVAKVKKKKPTKQSELKARKSFLLDIWSEAIRLIWDNKCGICGNGGNQAHHYFGKKAYPHVMFDIRNGMWACFGCHIIKTHRMGNAEMARDAIIKRIGVKEFEELKLAAYKIDENGESIKTKTLTLINLDEIEKKLINLINVMRISRKVQP